jgi:hypothetical protein
MQPVARRAPKPLRVLMWFYVIADAWILIEGALNHQRGDVVNAIATLVGFVAAVAVLRDHRWGYWVQLGFLVWAIGWFVLFLAREMEDLGLNFGVLVVGAIAAISVGVPLLILLLPSSRRWAMSRSPTRPDSASASHAPDT